MKQKPLNEDTAHDVCARCGCVEMAHRDTNLGIGLAYGGKSPCKKFKPKKNEVKNDM